MIQRIVMKENLSFKTLELELSKGLVVFTGLSGAGKSVLFKGILSCFALAESEAKLVEIELDDKLDLSEFGIEEEENNTFKMLKDKNAKYFINNQSITKKSLNSLSKGFVKYLSAKEEGEFSNENFLNLLDHLQNKKEPKFLEFVSEFRTLFEEFDEAKTALTKVQDEEKKVEELKELAALQIAKIEEVKPKVGEYEELMVLKKRLSKKDKIEAAWQRANAIFELEGAVLEALRLSELDSTFFTECLNELRISSQSQNFDELEFDIEALLDRIEKLSNLIQKYGSEAGALEHLAKKQKELEHYENLSFEKKELENKVTILQERLEKSAKLLHEKRVANLAELETLLNSYLAKLYMKKISLKLEQNEKISPHGFDECILQMDTTKLKNFSSGELNRLRLAFIATSSAILNVGRGIIFLDEIDANLSGKEAMSIALVLEELCEFYQIFAISHLPQLSSKAHNHFLVSKKSGVSFVEKLEKDERIDELARMVSGEKISKEALEFAKTLLSH